MDELTGYHYHVLKIVKQGQGKWGWHEISIRALIGDEPDEMPMPALKKLQSLGLVKQQLIAVTGNDRWEITESGKQLLEQQNDQRQ